MLQICEEYDFNYKITFYFIKSQLLYFSYLDKDHTDLLNLTMKHVVFLPWKCYTVTNCVDCISNTIYTQLYRSNAFEASNKNNPIYFHYNQLYPIVKWYK